MYSRTPCINQSTEIFNKIISQKSIYSVHLMTKLHRIILVLILRHNYSKILEIETHNWTKSIHCIKNGRRFITGTWTHCVISGWQEEKKSGGRVHCSAGYIRERIKCEAPARKFIVTKGTQHEYYFSLCICEQFTGASNRKRKYNLKAFKIWNVNSLSPEMLDIWQHDTPSNPWEALSFNSCIIFISR